MVNNIINLPKNREWIRITIILCFGLTIMAIFLVKEGIATDWVWGVPLDDAWIHYRFAENLQSGEGLSFNPGESTPGATSPLWVGILSLIDSGYLIPSKVIGILAYLGSGVLTYQIAKLFNLRWYYALIAGLATLAAGRFAWAAPSGMETTSFTLLTLAALWSWAKARKGLIPWYSSMLFGLACLLRPEGYLFLGLSGVDWLVDLRGKAIGWREIRIIARHLFIALAIIAPYFIFSYLSTGRVLPNTFYVKQGAWDCQPSLAYFAFIIVVFWLDNVVISILSIVGITWVLKSGYWQVKRGLLLSCIWILALPTVYGLLAPCLSGYYTRYTTPLIPMVMILGAFGGQELEAWLLNRWRRNKSRSGSQDRRFGLMRVLMVEGLVLAMIPLMIFWVPFYVQAVVDIQDMHINIGQWLAEESAPNAVIALNDIGAIGMMADRKVIDLMGLVTPEVIDLVRGKKPGEWDLPLAKYLHETQPDYLVIFPNWFPEMTKVLPLEEVYRVRLADRTIAGIQGLSMVGGGEMVVYQFDWLKDE